MKNKLTQIKTVIKFIIAVSAIILSLIFDRISEKLLKSIVCKK